MVEECKVKYIKKGLAYIEVKKKPQCESCRACAAFYSDNSAVIPAIMDVECKVGDRVVVEMPQKSFPLASLIMFLVPLLGFLIGLLVGMPLGELYMIIFAGVFFVCGLFLGFIANRMVQKNRKYMPIITLSLIDPEEKKEISIEK